MTDDIEHFTSVSGKQWIAHLSDLHLTSLADVKWHQLLSKRFLGYLSWRRKRQFEHTHIVLDAVCQELRRWPLEQLLISGDLTHIGLPEEYREVADWLGTVASADQVQLVPGNHDAYARRYWPQVLDLWRDYLASDPAPSPVSGPASMPTSIPASTPAGGLPTFPGYRVRGQMAFIGLNSACPKAPLLATGTVGRAQRETLSKLLEQARRQGLFRVVFVHHSPVPGEEVWRKRMTDAQQVQAVIAEQGAELVLHGHGHHALESRIDTAYGEVPVFSVASASANGIRGREPATYNCYAVAPVAQGWHFEAVTRAYQPDSHSFVTAVQKTLLLPRQT